MTRVFVHHVGPTPTVAEMRIARKKLAAIEGAKFAAGTGRKSLRRYSANLSERGRLTRREVAAIRRAIELGKAVPAELRAVV